MAIAGALPYIFCIFHRAISWRQEIGRNQNSNFYLEIRPGACCPVETEKPWGPDEHLPIYYKHPRKTGGTGSGMSFRVFGQVRLAERESVVAQAEAAQASRGHD